MSELSYGKEARQKIKEGVDKVANAVKTSIGPDGKVSFLTAPLRQQKMEDGSIRMHGGTFPTKDGVSIAHSISLSDPVENIGATMVKDCSGKTVMDAGDGTSASAVLLQSLITQGAAELEKDVNAVQLIEGINAACKDVVASLKKHSIPITTKEQLVRIATISANNDSFIGGLIAEATDLVGLDGIVQVQESATEKTWVDKVSGMVVESGLLSEKFINNPGKLTCEYEDVLILLHEQPITDYKAVASALDVPRRAGKTNPVVIIAPDFTPDVLSILITNTQKGIGQYLALKTPGRGPAGFELMNDIAAVTGATFLTTESGLSLTKVNSLDRFGQCKRLVASPKETVIIEGAGAKEAIEQRIAHIRVLTGLSEGVDKEVEKKRLASLTGGIAVLNVGGTTPMEVKERLDRVDDSLKACRAAQAEGYVIGGGVTFLKCVSENQRVGWNMVMNAIQEPYKQILINSGLPADTDHKERTKAMEKAQVYDPAKVLRCSLENAVSTASLFLNTEVAIVN